MATKEPGKNFLRQFRDKSTRDFKELTAAQFMDVWNHYDEDGNGYIEGVELEQFLAELITSACPASSSREVLSAVGFSELKAAVMEAFDCNKDGRIEIGELAEILPMEENFLLLFRRDNPLDSSVEFMKIWREFDSDNSGYIEADELKSFLRHLLKQAKRDADITEEQLIVYADTMLQLFDRNRDGKLQLSEMAKLLPVRENFLCRPIFKGRNRITKDDIVRVFKLYDRDGNGSIENEELHGFLKDLMELIHEDYDAQDLEECKSTLLKNCDRNKDGKINFDELTLVLMAMNNMSCPEEGSEPAPGEEEDQE
ncbi:calbindin-32-like [Liolophura sinensis]|uniref:calbindin-32-like n=1 Tax=Liolophura sinensis TaxID=3198878 RepID=UPI0031585029